MCFKYKWFLNYISTNILLLLNWLKYILMGILNSILKLHIANFMLSEAFSLIMKVWKFYGVVLKQIKLIGKDRKRKSLDCEFDAGTVLWNCIYPHPDYSLFCEYFILNLFNIQIIHKIK